EDDGGWWCRRGVELHEGFRADVWLGPSDRPPEQKALDGYHALLRDWPSLRHSLQEDAFELEKNYFDDRVPRGATAGNVWATMVDPTISCVSPGEYELTVTFSWQSEDDGHTVTFYVEGGVARGSSVDG